MTIGNLSEKFLQASSASSFDFPYAVIGWQGDASVRGIPFTLGPTAVKLLMKQNFFKCFNWFAAESKFFVVVTFPE